MRIKRTKHRKYFIRLLQVPFIQKTLKKQQRHLSLMHNKTFKMISGPSIEKHKYHLAKNMRIKRTKEAILNANPLHETILNANPLWKKEVGKVKTQIKINDQATHYTKRRSITPINYQTTPF